MKLVVLNGAGRGTLRVVCLTAVTWPGPASFSKTAVARASSVKRSSLWTALKLWPSESSSDLHHPERLGHEGPALPLPLGDEHQGGRLHPAHAQELAPQPRSGQRDEPGERGAPDEVDVLPGLAGPGQRLGQVVEMREGPLDLARGEGREARPPHGAHQLGVLFHGQIEGLKTDQLAFAVEVGGDDESRGVHGELLDRPDHRLGRLGLDQRSVDESLRLHLAPLRELRREVHLHHVALETHGGARLALGRR